MSQQGNNLHTTPKNIKYEKTYVFLAPPSGVGHRACSIPESLYLWGLTDMPPTESPHLVICSSLLSDLLFTISDLFTSGQAKICGFRLLPNPEATQRRVLINTKKADHKF